LIFLTFSFLLLLMLHPNSQIGSGTGSGARIIVHSGSGKEKSYVSAQYWGSVTFWYGSIPLTNGCAPDLHSDPTPFFSDFKDAKKNFHIFSL
jgi:hypothetical protein